MPLAFESIFAALAALVFVLLLVVTIPRVRGREQVIYHLALYDLLGLVSTISLLVGLLKVSSLPAVTFALIAQFGWLALALSFGALTLTFVKSSQRALISYWAGGMVILLLWGLFVFDVARLGQPPGRCGGLNRNGP